MQNLVLGTYDLHLHENSELVCEFCKTGIYWSVHVLDFLNKVFHSSCINSTLKTSFYCQNSFNI